MGTLFHDELITSIIDHFDEDLTLNQACQVAILVAVAQADGAFQEEEKVLLSNLFQKHYKIQVKVLEQLFQDVRVNLSEETSQQKIPLYCEHLKSVMSMQEKIVFIHIIKDLIEADHAIDVEEETMLKTILLNLGLNFDNFNL